jgi:thymidylate synthase
MEKHPSKHPEYQYLDLMREIVESGIEQTDKGTGVKTYSVFGRQIRYNLADGFPLLTTKKVYWKGVLHELFWFFSGQSNIRYLVENGVHIWDDYPYKMYKEKVERGEVEELSKGDFIEKILTDADFAKVHGELPHIYGEMWRRWQATDGRSVDQLKWVVEEIGKDPDCHNAIVTSWNPEYLYSMASPGKAARFPICHNMYQVNVKNGKLSLLLYQRSADIFLGVPFNIASYALLTYVLAKIAGYEPGEFIHTFGDVHVYENHFDQVREQLSRVPKSFPKVSIINGVTLESFKPEDVFLEGYDSHPTIKAELTVAGGYNKKLHS